MGAVRVVVTGVATAVAGVDGPARLLDPTAVQPGEDPVRRLTGRGMRYRDRATKLAFCAAQDALAHAGMCSEPDGGGPDDTTGIVVSSNFGNVDTIAQCADTIAAQTYAATSPMLLPATASNVTAAALAIRHGLRGANLTLCDGPTSGLDAVDWARILIGSGRVQRMLVVGVEPANPVVAHLLKTSGFDVDRVLDGAAALVVESAPAAAGRGATALATVGAYANGGSHDAVVATARRSAPGPLGLWLAPEAAVGDTVGAGATRDIGALLGHCSGALGVLQCAAAVAWLGAGGAGPVLATVGDDTSTAALLLGAREGGRI